jgi:DNA polymerase IIIc chi subunit
MPCKFIQLDLIPFVGDSQFKPESYLPHQTPEDHQTQIHTTVPTAANGNGSQRMLSSCYKLQKQLHL